MDSGGWPAAGSRHGRHRHGSVNSAWTPVVRPTEAGHLPSHARIPWAPPPGVDSVVEQAEHAGTASTALVPRQRGPEEAVVHVLTDTPPRGLRTFDLGSVPASVTPPRSWRRAAWFAVGTSAAVVCGLTVAAARLVGTPPPGSTIDALPAFPTQQLGSLPADETATAATATTTRTSPPPSTRPDTAHRTGEAPPRVTHPSVPGASSVAGTTSGPVTSAPPAPPPRTTVGPAPLMLTDPEEMGDRTEEYFALVTEDPEAAHEMCAGGMAIEGPDGIESRYAGVDHVEVQEITIDRNAATTTSKVKIVRDDGNQQVEKRRLRFTWGGNPKISDDAPAPS